MGCHIGSALSRASDPQIPETGRELLTGNRTYYVGSNLGAVTISIASPAVVSKTAHGLIAGSRVSFSILPNTKTATISSANPAVVTMTNSFSAGQPIRFATTGRLPPGLSASTTYYVIAAGLSGSSFRFSTSVGGSAVDTSAAQTFTVTIASPGVFTKSSHGLSIGDAIQLATTGALPTGLAINTTYFVKTTPTGNTFTVSATPEGAAINTSGTQSGTHSLQPFGTHYVSEWGTLPTGITAGQDYHVIATGLTADQFQFSATSGGSAVNTSGSTEGTISAKTGDNTTGDGSSEAPWLTLNKAWSVITGLDLGGFTVTIQLADGTYLSGLSASVPVVGGLVTINGNSTTPSNVIVSTSSANAIGLNAVAAITAQNFCVQTTTSEAGLRAIGFGSKINLGVGMIFGACGTAHMWAQSGGYISVGNNYTVAGNAPYHYQGQTNAILEMFLATVTLIGIPAFTAFASLRESSSIVAFGMTYSGPATGKRYEGTLNGVANTFGGGANFFPGNAAGTTATGAQYA